MSDDILDSMKTMTEAPTKRSLRFRIGDVILGRYTVTDELGQGGMGIVYKCLDTIGGIEVALKALPPELSHNTLEMEDIRDNFQLVSRLSHTNIASIRTLERDAATGDYYLVMECVSGENLRFWIKKIHRESGVVSLEQALPVLRQAAAALDYAHDEKIVHRDIKPGNIMVTQNGTVKVLDFGLAAEIHNSMSRVSMAYRGTSGTGPYMAPEQWRGRRQGAAADQYALAVTAYEMLEGKLPFENADASVLREVVLNERPEVISRLPRPVMTALLRALSKEPSERFASCSDFVAALGGAKFHAKTQRRKGGKRVVRWLVGVGALVIAAYSSYLFYQSYQSDRSDQQRAAQILQAQVAHDAATQAKIAGLVRATDAALSSGDLKEAGAKIAELEQVPGSTASVATLRIRYESLAGERETNKRYADASIAHDSAMKFESKQTLGAAQEALERKWREAEAAHRGKSWGQALSAYDAVIAQSGELAKLDGLREAAKTQRDAAEQAKQSAESAKADTYATTFFKDGKTAISKAEHAFEGGDFVVSGKAWEEAAADYAKSLNRSLAVQAYNKAKADYAQAVALNLALFKTHGGKLWNEVDRQARLGDASENDSVTGAEAYGKALLGLPGAVAQAKATERAARLEFALSTARSAKERKDWTGVVTAAGQALAIDSDSAEAKQLKDEAEKNILSQWRLVAIVDGQEVSATATIGGKAYTLPQTLTLKDGASYEVSSLTYESGGKRYTADAVSATANWKGLQERRIVLEERKEPRPGEIQKVPLAPGIDVELVWCPAGSFMMGSPVNEAGRDTDETEHRVTLTKGFWMGKHEVTQAQWEAVTGSNPSSFNNAGKDAPVERISWDDCQKFIQKVNARVSGGGFRLPTEAEWEYAARGGSQGRGYVYSGGNNLDDLAWYDNNSGGTTHPVGQKQANELGLYDMSGNAWEWCSDGYSDYQSGNVTDPTGSGSGSSRVSRGGCRFLSARLCRSAYRGRNASADSGTDLGLRFARDSQ